jgi:hypothetical protein
MFKFLRKYDKWILAVGGTLLMITFLVPQAIQGLSQYSAQTGATWATVGAPPTTISVGDADRLRRQSRLIDSLGAGNMLNQLGAGSDPAHWYLLLREAEAAGFVGGPSSGYAYAEQLAANSGEGVTTEMVIATLGGQAGLNYPDTLETLAEVQGVARLMAIVSSAGRFSDTRLRGAAARKGLGLSGDVVVIDARTNTTVPASAVDDAALTAQFDAHADALAGEGDRGFGYRVPDRFRVEWMTITKDAVRASLENSPELAPIELRKAFQRNPEKFGASRITTSASAPSFSDHADTVRTTMLDELVDARMKEIAKFADDRLQFPRRGLTATGLHLELPADWPTRRTQLPTLASEIATEFDIPAPIHMTSGDDWLGIEALSDSDRFGDIGNAGTDLFGRSRTSLSKLVPSLREFGGSETVPVQSGVAFPPLTTAGGDLVIARVTAADPAHAPADLAEVRAQVTADLEAVMRYETLVERLPEIESVARSDGMRAVAEAYGVPLEFAADIRQANLDFLIQYGISMSTPIPGLGSDAEAIEAVVERAMSLDPTVPIADQPAEKRIFAIEVPEKLTIVLVSIDAVTPLTAETWKRLASNPANLQRAIAQDLAPIDPIEMFSFDALKQRHAFELGRSSNVEDEFETEGTPAEPAS